MHHRRLPAAALAALALLAAAGPAGAQAASPAAAPSAGAPLVTVPSAAVGQVVRFRGAVRRGARVEVQRLVAGRGWVRTATARARADGRYLARWRATEPGRFTVRALVRSRGARTAAAPATARVTIFRTVRATWYGPGLYGNRTACGQVMSEDLMGVAHRTLPCGTPVEVFAGGRSFVVPVVDRGPFANGAHYDLTAALARNLDFMQTGDVGVLPRRGQRMDPPPAPDALATGDGGGAAPPPQ